MAGRIFAIGRQKLNDECSILDGIGTATVHAYRMMDATGFDEKVRIVVNWCNRVHLMPLVLERPDKVHPKVEKYSGGVETIAIFISNNRS